MSDSKSSVAWLSNYKSPAWRLHQGWFVRKAEIVLQVASFTDEFCRRWMKEVFPSLTEHEKWYRESPNLEEGDITIIIDLATPLRSWPTGRILIPFLGDDGVVHFAIIYTNETEPHQPSHVLFLLESVKIRGDALHMTKRRAGDLAVPEPAKIVRLNLDLAKPQEW